MELLYSLGPEVVLGLLEDYSPPLLYVVLAAASLLENLLPMLPGDLIVVLGGYLSGIGKLDPVLAYGVVNLGSWAGFMVFYYVGRRLGRSALKVYLLTEYPHRGINRAEQWFLRYGWWMVLANRFLAGTRSAVSLFAGYAGLAVRLTAALSLLSCLGWNALLVTGGWWVGDEWERLVDWLELYNRILLAGVALAAGAWLLWWLTRVRWPRRP